METNSDTRLFGVSRPSPEPESESDIEPEEKYSSESEWDTASYEKSEEKYSSESESEWESEEEYESESEPEQEQEEASKEHEHEQEEASKSESESDTEQPWIYTSKPIEDLVESDFYRYDDDPVSYYFSCPSFTYKNKAKKKQEEETKRAVAEYRERSRNLTLFDAIPVPTMANIDGNSWAKPADISSDEVHTRLIHLSNLALAKYHARNQGTTRYVFEKLVKATCKLNPVRTYYITFEAKEATHVDLSNCPAIIFQAHVWDRSLLDKPSVVRSCAMKPT